MLAKIEVWPSLSLLAALAAAACDKDAAPTTPGLVCTPGQSVACACASGAMGAQTCLPTGSYDACQCADAGPPVDAAVALDADAAVALDADAAVALDADAAGPEATVDADAAGPEATVDADAAPCPLGQELCGGRCQEICGGRCVDTRTELAHCGACGRACPVPANGTASCVGGTCAFACAVGYVPCSGCGTARCDACGGAEQPCCEGSSCLANLTCVSGTCRCGARDQPCCGGTACGAGLTCASGTCQCGGLGQTCCAGGTCGGGLRCGGAACGCVRSYDSSFGITVLRTDGSVWNNGYDGRLWSAVTDASLSVIRDFQSITRRRYGGSFACGVRADHTAWCWLMDPTFPNGRPHQDRLGILGNGLSTDPPLRRAVQVITAPGAPLADVVAVESEGALSCALTRAGRIYCWGGGGPGTFGNGATPESRFATPVLVAAGGAPFADARLVRVSGQHVCALKTDNTLWCWGSNAYGQVGDGTTVEVRNFPVRVQGILGTVADVDINGWVSCAVTTDGSAWCWGNNSFGELGTGASGPGSFSATPLRVRASATTFLDRVAEIRPANQGSCALRTDGTAWCWGRPGGAAGAVFPTQVGRDVASTLVFNTMLTGLGTDGRIYLGYGESPTPMRVDFPCTP